MNPILSASECRDRNRASAREQLRVGVFLPHAVPVWIDGRLGVRKTTPTPFGPERATSIWGGRGVDNCVRRADMTAGEQAYVDLVWLAGSPNCSWHTAFWRIQHDDVKRALDL